ncbi:MAG: sigma-70 family RNA polymerase sigma factor [Cellulosilyticaceae bacterium]
MKITEDNFIEQAKLGNEQALEYILTTYGWVIETVVRKHLYKLKAYEEECMNDILMGIWSNIGRYDPEQNTFKNWVAAISRYKSFNYLKKYLKDLENENVEDLNLTEEDNTTTIITENELGEKVSMMLNCLKEKDRELFIKLYIEEQDMNQISAETGMKREVIYNRVSRGKKKIQQLFSKTNKSK